MAKQQYRKWWYAESIYYSSGLFTTVNKDQGVFVEHYAPAATKSKKLFLASRSKLRSQGN